MKKTILIFFLFFVCLTLFSQDKKRAAILDFKATEFNKTIIETVYKNFSSLMADTQEFSIVERKDIDKIFAEQNIQLGDEFNESLAVDIGNLAGAQLVFMGEITKSLGKIHITIKGVDVETAIIQFSKTVSVENENSIIDSLSLLVNQIVLEKKGIKEDKYTAKQKQVLLDDMNFKINTMKMDIINMENTNLIYQNQKKPVLINLITWTSLFGLTAVGTGVSFGLFNYYYYENSVAISISDITRSKNNSYTTFFLGVGLASATLALLFPTVGLISYFIYISNHSKKIERIRNQIQNYELEKQKIIGYYPDVGFTNDRLFVCLNVKF